MTNAVIARVDEIFGKLDMGPEMLSFARETFERLTRSAIDQKENTGRKLSFVTGTTLMMDESVGTGIMFEFEDNREFVEGMVLLLMADNRTVRGIRRLRKDEMENINHVRSN